MVKIRSKRFSLLIVLVLIASLMVGCGGQTANQPAEQQESTVTINDVAKAYYDQMPEHIYKIDNEELKERIDAKDDSMLIISIRSAEDYAIEHIQGAVNIPFKQVNEYLDKLPADKDLIVYCYSGQTAGQTVAIMNMYGYNARSLNLGLNKGWVEKYNFPIETTPHELPANVTPAKPDPAIAKILQDYYVNLPEHGNKIKSKELKQMIDDKEDMQIVSIRSAEDFAKGHIPGAINIPFKAVGDNFDKFDTDKPVFVYCYSGQTAGQTVAVLNVLGINARSVTSGFNLGWEPAELPVEK